MSKPAVKIAALAFEIAPGGVPGEAHLLPVGPFRSTDGRPEDADAWQLDATIAVNVIARLRARKNDTLIDYEHQNLRKEQNGQKNLAAGWFHDMEWRDSKGLYAVGVDWTEDAKKHILKKEYRYISSLFIYLAGTGEVLDIINVTMTNTPGLDGLDSLDSGEIAALTKHFYLPHPETENDDMPKPEEQLAALTVERDGLNTQVAALTVERDSLKTSLAALTTERDDLKTQVAALTQAQAVAAQAAEQQKHTDLLNAALTDGRLAPAQKPWAEKQSLAALTEYLEATGPLPVIKKQAGDEHSPSTVALTAEQKDIAEKMGVSEEDFIATQKKHAKA